MNLLQRVTSLALMAAAGCSSSPSDPAAVDTSSGGRDTGAGDVIAPIDTGAERDTSPPDAGSDLQDGTDDQAVPDVTRDVIADTADLPPDAADVTPDLPTDRGPLADIPEDEAGPDSGCVDRCEAGTTTCEGDSIVRCVDFDRDGCVEPTATVICVDGQTCRGGACVTPGIDVVISEVWYDPPGADTDCFVELYGPPGTPLTGWSLVGVNGNGGEEYVTIALSGSIPADGLFVIAQTGATGDVGSSADLRSPGVDLQNGPDNLLLLQGDTVIDSLGYETFGSSEIFLGESRPAAGPPASASLARNADYADTNDNSADFDPLDPPTPGAPNTSVNRAPVAIIDALLNVAVGATVELDGDESSDPDGDELSFAWSLTPPAGSGASLTTPTAATSRFVADIAGTYAVSLTVTDSEGAVHTADANIVAVVTPNMPPMADAGDDVAIPVDDIAVLDGSGSSDPDGTIVSYLWTLVAAPDDAVFEIVDEDTAELWFTAETPGDYTLSLTVTDDDGAIDTDTVVVTVGSVVTPTAIVINEIHIDTPGGDTQAFVELCGAPGQSVEGLRLVGVNGSSDADYNPITLTGTLDSSGYYLVAQTGASFAGSAQVVTGSADYQNGPDSIQLRDAGGVVLDAIAYENFDSGDEPPRGEGATVDLPEDDTLSLQRDGVCRDTNDNARDFAPGTPSPGERNSR